MSSRPLVAAVSLPRMGAAYLAQPSFGTPLVAPPRGGNRRALKQGGRNSMLGIFESRRRRIDDRDVSPTYSRKLESGCRRLERTELVTTQRWVLR